MVQSKPDGGLVGDLNVESVVGPRHIGSGWCDPMTIAMVLQNTVSALKLPERRLDVSLLPVALASTHRGQRRGGLSPLSRTNPLDAKVNG